MRTSTALALLATLLFVSGAAASSRHLLGPRPVATKPPPPPRCPAITPAQSLALNVRSWDDCEAPKATNSKPCKGSCARGYGGQVMAHCDKAANGLSASWRFTGNCSLIVCSSPLPAVANATWASNCGIALGSTCTATCSELYTQTAPINTTCVPSHDDHDDDDDDDDDDEDRKRTSGRSLMSDDKSKRRAPGVWSTPAAACVPATITQAVVAVPAVIVGGCTPEATQAVVTAMTNSLAAQQVTGQQVTGYCRELTASAAPASALTTTGPKRHLLQAGTAVEFVIVIVYVGNEAAVQTVVAAINTDNTSIIDLQQSLAQATNGTVTIEVVVAETKNTTVSSTPLDATLSLVRSGPASVPAGSSFFLTAVYTGTNGLAAAGVTLAGPTVSPAGSVTCTPQAPAPLTNAVGMAVWSCTAGADATTAVLSVSGPNPTSGVDVSASVSVPVIINCVGAWGPPSACSVACGPGTAVETYIITTNPSLAPAGAACPIADGTQRTVACTGATTCGDCEQCTAGACAAVTDGNTCPTGKCLSGVCTAPVDCVGAFGAWSACSATCRAGTQTRTYTITTAANAFGQPCSNATGDVETQACAATTTCGECSTCDAAGTGCTPLTAGEPCSNQGSCYDGVCQAGVVVNNIMSLSTEWQAPYNNSMLFNTNAAATPTIETLANEVNAPITNLLTVSVTDGITTNPPDGITRAVRIVSPTSTTKPEFGTAFLNNTPSHPIGLFHGMKFKTFLQEYSGAFKFSWYQANVTGQGTSAPVFRFTVINPAWAGPPTYSVVQSFPGRVEFLWMPGNNFAAGAMPVNEWRTETVDLNNGKFIAFLSKEFASRFLLCPQTLGSWLNATTCGATALPWLSDGVAKYGTANLFADGIIWDMRMGAYDGKKVFYANNLQASAKSADNTKNWSWTYRVVA